VESVQKINQAGLSVMAILALMVRGQGQAIASLTLWKLAIPKAMFGMLQAQYGTVEATSAGRSSTGGKQRDAWSPNDAD